MAGMKISIGAASKELGVSITTLRRCEAEGKIQGERTPKGHRRYDLAQLRGLKPYEASQTNRPTLCYARVSSQEQKEDLERQIRALESFCAANGWTYEVMQDLGSGLNYNKKGLQQLIRRICSGRVGRLVVTNKDRLLRFGSEWYGCRVLLADRFYPSTKRCSACGQVREIGLQERQYHCPVCRMTMDRDLKAAINLEQLFVKETTASSAGSNACGERIRWHPGATMLVEAGTEHQSVLGRFE
jgi:predicted site-specific integrase-resolvase